jgi:hypothetical protein
VSNKINTGRLIGAAKTLHFIFPINKAVKKLKPSAKVRYDRTKNSKRAVVVFMILKNLS